MLHLSGLWWLDLIGCFCIVWGLEKEEMFVKKRFAESGWLLSCGCVCVQIGCSESTSQQSCVVIGLEEALLVVGKCWVGSHFDKQTQGKQRSSCSVV